MQLILKRIRHIFANMDKPLLILSIGMFIFGLLNIVTASSREAVVNYDLPLYYYFFQQLKMIIIGLILSFFILNINTTAYRTLAPIGFVIILIFAILPSFHGEEIKGAKNWLNIMGFQFQPSELAKPVIIVTLAVLFEKYTRVLRDKNTRHWDIIGIILFVGLAIPLIVFFQKDFGTMFIMGCIWLIMFLASPIFSKEKIKTFGFLAILIGVGCMLLITKQGYILSEAQLERFNFRNPCSVENYEKSGYQTCNGLIALNGGGAFGLGIGKSKQKYSYIPEPHTDSVFAIIGEEYGVLRSSFIFVAYILILYRILKIASGATTTRGRFICLGIASGLFMHILVNMGGLFDVMPLTGVPLPFLSYGGSYTIALLCSLALVQKIQIETNLKHVKVNV